MNHANTCRTVATMLSAGLASAVLGLPLAASAAANPCAPESRATRAANPCAANPCAARNPGVASAVQRPAGYQPYKGNRAGLVAAGEKLFSDKSLSTNDSSCATCHTDYAAYKTSFIKPYPHRVEMAANTAGMKQIQLDEMVQLCITTPMAGKALDWKSRDLAALVAYAEEQQKGYKDHLKKKP